MCIVANRGGNSPAFQNMTIRKIEGTKSDAFAFTAELEGDGAATLTAELWDTDIAWITNVSVPEPHRRQGIATQLIAAMEEEYKRRGCNRVRLEVASDNIAARNLYKKLGYRRTHTWGGYYGEGKSDGVVMYKRI